MSCTRCIQTSLHSYRLKILSLFILTNLIFLLVLKTVSCQSVLKTRQPNIYCRDAHFCRQQEQRVANGSPATHQTLWQQGETGEDGHIYLADWTLIVAAIMKKKNKLKMLFAQD